MSQINRLADGGRLNRAKVIRFWYDDKQYEGHPGDTLASALLANGVHLIGRSFKYHRPRGIFSAGPEEPNALVQLENGPHTEPNRRATEVELYEGLVAQSQNCWPSVGFDLGAVNARLSRLLPAGFYYKTFMWPRALWMGYEKMIRRAAGLGRAPAEPDPDRYDKTHAHCDVLVVGGGPAGLQAACAAGATGARVMLVDERSEFGGSLLDQGPASGRGGWDAAQWLVARLAELRQMKQVTLLPRTTVTGCYDDNFLVANERVTGHLGPTRGDHAPRERLWKIRARRVVLATGSIERPLIFADNDRPGVMLAGAVRAYINRFGVLPGRRIVVLTNNDSAYHTALDAYRAGATVEVVDIRRHPGGQLTDQARALGIAIHPNSAVSAVDTARGKITRVRVMTLSEDGGEVRGAARALGCDVVAVSGGWTPTVHLFSQAKGELAYHHDLHCFVPGKPSAANPLVGAGACCGAYTLAECLAQGRDAGRDAAAAAGFAGCADSPPAAQESEIAEPRDGPVRALWVLPCEHPLGRGPKKHFHDLQNDVTVADIHLAAREGFESVEHLKRYTTTGMGTDQGKTSNLNALAALSEWRGAPIPEIGVTTFRPPYTPLTFGAVAGHERRDLFLQKRTTPMHPWHEQRGAVYEDVGDWKRPLYFPARGEDMAAAVRRECLAARNAVGILDASTLGKIDIVGEHALELLDMVYANAWGGLAVGRCRYGLMLNEHGMVFDDGVTTRLGEHHYHMTTTTGGAARVLNWLEEWLQTEWPGRARVYCTSVTEQWAVASISGPHSRALLAQLCDEPLDGESFPFMSMREFAVAGIPARVFRVSFTGELAFEINVPARFGLALWQKLMAAGEPYGICAYGTEAMHVLRAEKGFIIVGQDTDGTVTPMDLGMDWIVSKNKADFAGKRSFSRADTARTGRKQLVGLLTEDPGFVLPEGAHLVEALGKPPMKMLGHVSSSYLSPNLGRSIALALVEDGLRRKGETLQVALMDGGGHKVTLTDTVFFDPDGGRARG
ncbi:MAG: sarcosine oxidase subunit alpha family protein [Gammaproteobacteria bacterium]|nr:sarcosine oxidase subunit alpha family protein [Gammaproteobacteria bacterium]